MTKRKNMAIAVERSRIPADELVAQVRAEMIALGRQWTYFSLTPLADDELRQYLEDPLAALPPSVAALLQKVEFVLVPYLEKGNGKGDVVCFERPAESRQIFTSRTRPRGGTPALVLAVRDEDLADYHYSLYNSLAGMVSRLEGQPALKKFTAQVREELAAEIHGEVDDKSWHLKQALLRRPANFKKETPAFREYVRQSFEDTLTLYLHGICCDIDVETGPRQMPSRYVRKRLELLMELFPPPDGYAVLPEQIRKETRS